MIRSTLFAAGLAASAFLATPAFADGHLNGDAAAGEKIFKRCTACHQVGDGAKHAQGPDLNNIFGRTAGKAEGFTKFGDGLIAAGEAGLVWNEEEMFKYLEHPTKYLRAYLDDKKAKSKMALKLKKDEQRANVIAYLMQFSPDYQTGGEAEAEEGENAEASESTN